MPTPEMQKAISRLRFQLTAIKDKAKELESLRKQFERQLSRAINYGIHGGNSLDVTLGAMAEVQERFDDVDGRLKHLKAIGSRAEGELDALVLTHKVEQAKRELASLKASDHEGGGVGRKRAEIEKLERFIQEASMRAAEAITGKQRTT